MRIRDPFITGIRFAVIPIPSCNKNYDNEGGSPVGVEGKNAWMIEFGGRSVARSHGRLPNNQLNRSSIKERYHSFEK
jgi:hypothetical protein